MGVISHKEKTFEQRLTESTEILKKHPDRICVYIEKKENCKSLPDIEKKKYLVPITTDVAQFIYIIRNKVNISKEQALFIYINNTIINGSITMGEVNNKYKSDDGFLYIKYTGENVFG